MKKAEREAMMREKLVLMKEFENKLALEGNNYIAGVDEVGRGPLAGPVVAACVILPNNFNTPGLDDSKKLTEKRRNAMLEVVHNEAIAYGLGMASPEKIDEVNILEATKGAMKVAIAKAEEKLKEKTGSGIDHILFDAIEIDDVKIPQTSIVHGDSRSVSIAAASILAKVTRDAMMGNYAERYPGYSFETNKGYGTKAHYEGIDKHGITPIHRKSFLKNVVLDSDD